MSQGQPIDLKARIREMDKRCDELIKKAAKTGQIAGGVRKEIELHGLVAKLRDAVESARMMDKEEFVKAAAAMGIEIECIEELEQMANTLDEILKASKNFEAEIDKALDLKNEIRRLGKVAALENEIEGPDPKWGFIKE